MAEDSKQRLSGNLIRSVVNTKVLWVAGQVGCATLVIILLTLVAGVWLDRSLDTLPLFTLLFLIGSMPLNWVVVFWIVNRAKKQLMSSSLPGVTKPASFEEKTGDGS